MNNRGFAGLAVLALLQVALSSAQAQEPFKLNVQEKGYIQPPQGNASYPAPQMSHPMQAGTQQQTLQAGTQSQMLQAGVSEVVLPQSFMGEWLVEGTRQAVTATKPEQQAGFERSFGATNKQLWNIKGSKAQGYVLESNTGIQTAIKVVKVAGETAFIAYKHPVYGTEAQEQIVMKLNPGGSTFDGLENIAIVKEGEQQPRAKVKYALYGQRSH